MDYFNLHFFKERERSIDFEAIVRYFTLQPNFEIQMDDSIVKFTYTHPTLNYQASFYITQKSKVPNLHELSPQYLEVNMHLQIPILTPTFMVKKYIEMVKQLCLQFNFYTYSEFFEDVLPFRAETIYKAFSLVKVAYEKKYPLKSAKYTKIYSEKLSVALRYQDEKHQLIEYYQKELVNIPDYLILKNQQSVVYFAIEWNENTLTVFPPQLQYLIYQSNNNVKVIPFEEFSDLANKYLTDVPGFLRGTKVLLKKNAKKVFKLIKKSKFAMINEQFNRITIVDLMD